MNLAVEKFKEVIPDSIDYSVLQANNQNELFAWLSIAPSANHIIFGHGTTDGLVLPNGILNWSILKSFIHTLPDKYIPVMACYSGYIDKNYGGWRRPIDAEAAGILGAQMVAISLVDDSLEEYKNEYRLKQAQMNNPLILIKPGQFVYVKDGYPTKESAYQDAKSDRDNGEPQNIEKDPKKAPRFPDDSRYNYVTIRPLIGGKYAENNPVIIDSWFQYSGNDIIDNLFAVMYVVDDLDDSEEMNGGNPHVIPIVIGLGLLLEAYQQNKKNIRDTVQQFMDGVITTVQGVSTAIVGGIIAVAMLMSANPEVVLTMVISLVGVTVLALAGSSIVAFLSTIVQNILGIIEGLALVAVGFILSGWLLDGTIVGQIETACATEYTETELEEIEGYTDDTDNDGLSDEVEYKIGTDPDDSDSDADGYEDGWEFEFGYDPMDSSDPYTMKTASMITFGSTTVEYNGFNLDEVDKIKFYRNDVWISDVNVSVLNSYTCDLSLVSPSTQWNKFTMKYYDQIEDDSGTDWELISEEDRYVYDTDIGVPTDSDSDFLSDYIETILGTSNSDSDSDDDGLLDYDEYAKYGTNPNDDDTDNDGISDYDEVYNTGLPFPNNFPDEDDRGNWDVDYDGNLNWLDYDSDGDGLYDGKEDDNLDGDYDSGSDTCDLYDNDTDNDGILDGNEVNFFGTEPDDDDTDNDGLKDGWEIFNGLDPLVVEDEDFALSFVDCFGDTSESEDIWTDDSTYGSLSRGGLSTTTVYNAESSNEDFVTTFYISGNDYYKSTSDPMLKQYSSSSIEYGFVVTWHLPDLRGESVDEAIAEAEIDVDYQSSPYWDSTDDMDISLVNLFYNGYIYNDSSDNAHANETLYRDPLRTLTNIDAPESDWLSLDITDLVSYWFIYTNSENLSLMFTPNDDNSVGGTYETLQMEEDSWTPDITVKTGDSVLRPDSYGSTTGWHGPEWYHNFGCDVDDFNMSSEPYFQGSTTGRGLFYMRFYSGDDGTGTEVGRVDWYDNSGSVDRGYLVFRWNTASTTRYVSGSTEYNDFYTQYTDNFTIIREGTSIDFIVNGVSKYSHATTGGSTDIRSVVIWFTQYSSYTIAPKMGLRSFDFAGHSDDYDDDGLFSSEEQSYDGYVWNADTDDDGMPDGWEATYYPTLQLDEDDSAENPDGDAFTNLEEYEYGYNPISYTTLATVLATSRVYEGPSEDFLSEMKFTIGVSGTYYIKIEYRINTATWTTHQWTSSYYSTGSYQIDDDWGWGDSGDWCYTRYSIYMSDGTTLLSQQTKFCQIS